MKPSHLASLVLAAIGVGGMSSAAVQSQAAIYQIHPTQANKHAVDQSSRRMISAMRLDLSSPFIPITQCPATWQKKNQRQIRLARRRSHAAGNKKAFKS